jgi:5'-nucleotidase
VGKSADNQAEALGTRQAEKIVPSLAASPKPHRILVVNDDGIDAEGIKLLEELAHRWTDDVWVVAPDEEKSGFSHAISMTVPVRMRKIDDRHYAVKGTPTDCALLGIYELMGDLLPTVLLSGVNRGANLAEDVTYSGTAAAAMEGALLGIRSIALSQVFTIGGEVHWATARRFAPAILEKLFACDWQPGSFVNVNFPDAPPDQVTGERVTMQARRLPGSFKPVRRVDERNFPYYWIKLAYETAELEVGGDLRAIAENAISITPLQMDMTANSFRHYLDQKFRGA